MRAPLRELPCRGRRGLRSRVEPIGNSPAWIRTRTTSLTGKDAAVTSRGIAALSRFTKGSAIVEAQVYEVRADTRGLVAFRAACSQSAAARSAPSFSAAQPSISSARFR